MTAVDKYNNLNVKKPSFTSSLSDIQNWDSTVLDSDRLHLGDVEHTLSYWGAVGASGDREEPLRREGETHGPCPLPTDQGKAEYPDIQPFNIPQTIKWTPGYGESYPKCGTVRFKVQCSESSEHYETLARETCHRPACPTCYDVWARRAAQDAFFRVRGYKDATKGQYDPRHVVLSPPNDLLKDVPQETALQWLYDKTREHATTLGLSAYLAIPHPYRIYPDKQNEISLLADKAGMNRYEYALSLPNWRDYVYFSPHMHLICYGHMMNSNDFHLMTGWVYRNHGSRRGKALEATIHYLLTHAWVRGNTKVCRYFKGMSTHTLKAREVGYTIELVLCPVCNAPCISLPGYLQDDGNWNTPVQNLQNATKTTRKVRLSPLYYIPVGDKPEVFMRQVTIDERKAIYDVWS